MILFGAGGMATVTIEILRAQNLSVFCCIDDDKNLPDLLGVQVLHSNALKDPSIVDRNSHAMIICFGNCELRANIAKEHPGNFGKAIHPTAIISELASVGDGSIVVHGSVIQARAVIGRHTIVNTSSSIDHDCIIGDFVHIAPNSTLCGKVHVHDRAEIGAGATIIQDLTIGEGAIIGAGSVVLHDIPAFSVAAGVPAKIIKHRPD